MKLKFFLALISFAVLFACGGKKENESKEQYAVPEPTTQQPTPAADPIVEGEALVKGSDCKTCHDPIKKIIGPSHTDVAKKYDFTAANVKLLADKIRNGGQGVWGQIPMTAHPDITQSDAEKMARYVLSLDGEKEH